MFDYLIEKQGCMYIQLSKGKKYSELNYIRI